MLDTHERILQKLAESGQKEFSAEMIKGIIDKIEDEEVNKMYAAYLRDNEPANEAAYLTSWEEVTEDLSGFPELKDSPDMEMER